MAAASTSTAEGLRASTASASGASEDSEALKALEEEESELALDDDEKEIATVGIDGQPLAPKHQKALVELRGKLGDVKMPTFFDTDDTLLRFLKARKFNVEKAEAMYRAMVTWRETTKPERLTPDDCPKEFASGKAFQIGEDKTGAPVFLIYPARHDPKNSDADEVMRLVVYWCEELIRVLGPRGGKTASILIDLKGWGLKNRDHDLDKVMFDTVLNNYPERLGTAYAINVPTVFKVAWTVIKPWLDKPTRRKIKMISGKDPREGLLKYFAPESLPEIYGGTLKIDLEPKTAKPTARKPKAVAMS